MTRAFSILGLRIGLRIRLIMGLIMGLLATAFALLPLIAHARIDNSVIVAQAEAAYAQGVELTGKDDEAARARFIESAGQFEQAIDIAATAPLLFNRANALLRAGDLGPAIADFRAAQARAPGDARIAANLAEARAKVTRSPGVPAPSGLERIGQLWAFSSELARWSVTVALLWAAAIAFILHRPAIGRSLMAVAMIVALTVTLDVTRRASMSTAVVLEPTTLRKGNGDGFDTVLAETLPEGTECRMRESRPGWAQIELADGTRGWLHDTMIVPAR